MPTALPLLGEERPERADAAENRRKVLAAAEELFASLRPLDGHDGRGRRRGRRGQGHALPPLRRPREPRARGDLRVRVRAPGRAAARRAAARPRRAAAGAPDRVRRGLRRVPGTPRRPAALGRGLARAPTCRSAPYAFYRTHIALLLREAGLGDRADYLADVILGPLASTSFRYQRGLRQLSCAELADAHADLCTRLLDSTR